MLEIVYKRMPAEGQTIDPKDKDFWPGFHVMWEKIVLDKIGVKKHLSFDKSIQKYIDELLKLHKSAEQNGLYYDV